MLGLNPRRVAAWIPGLIPKSNSDVKSGPTLAPREMERTGLPKSRLLRRNANREPKARVHAVVGNAVRKCCLKPHSIAMTTIWSCDLTPVSEICIVTLQP